jgi:hypothetical protein
MKPTYKTLERGVAVLGIALLLCGLFPPQAKAYAVMAHEAIIDASWDTGIKPLLLRRFPNATPDDLRQAHAYAYGGAIIQDLGYYPHGSHLFSDLVHYVRSGDFIEAMLRDANDLNEYAFALGALSHYSADNEGHKVAVNRAVPLLYPELKRKYGDVVTYAEDPLAHMKTEFGFDVIEIAKGRYAPDSYRDFIGFEVSKPLLQRAFLETYCISLNTVFKDFDRSVNSYRYDVSTIIPKATRVAWQLKKDEIEKDEPTMTRQKFLYHLSRASYEKKWGQSYDQPGLGTKIVALIIRIIPKIGPLKALKFRTPTPQAENMLMASFNAAMDSYAVNLKAVPKGNLNLPDTNFDTGDPIKPGAYTLADAAYADLLDYLQKDQFRGITPELRANILQYYSDTRVSFATKKHPKDWARLMRDLDQMKTSPNAQPGQVAVTFLPEF